MPTRPILEYPDPRLRQPSAPVTTFDTNLAQLAQELLETLYTTGGIGLSAPQTGAFHRILVMDHSGNATAPEIYVNPEIQKRTAFGLVEESCLSVPGIKGNVFRATKLHVQARDQNGTPFERHLTDMPAVCLQHEIDHLNGKLFIDRLWPWRRLLIHARAARAKH